MSIVIIAEKPSVAEDLANILGVRSKQETHWFSDDIIITWAIGHLLELKYMDDYDDAFKNWRGTVDRLPFIPENFQYKPKSGRGKKQLSAILKLIKAKGVTEIVNACDAAREGELIFRTIVQHAKTKVPTSRMWMQSMTADAMLKAFEERQSGSTYQALSCGVFAIPSGLDHRHERFANRHPAPPKPRPFRQLARTCTNRHAGHGGRS